MSVITLLSFLLWFCIIEIDQLEFHCKWLCFESSIGSIWEQPPLGVHLPISNPPSFPRDLPRSTKSCTPKKKKKLSRLRMKWSQILLENLQCQIIWVVDSVIFLQKSQIVFMSIPFLARLAFEGIISFTIFHKHTLALGTIWRFHSFLTSPSPSETEVDFSSSKLIARWYVDLIKNKPLLSWA